METNDQPTPDDASEGSASRADPSCGEVDLVGAGPGDPGLITVRGADRLRQAEVVVYDHLVNPRLLRMTSPGTERIFAGKSRGKCAMKQTEINDLLVSLARQGRRVVRLKGGDPFVFGRGGEEAEHLRASGIRFRIVPGITAGVGVSAYAGIPVTHRGIASAVALITGHDDPISETSRLDWPALARFPGTLVVYMGVGRLPTICEILTRNGKTATTPACVIQNGTLGTQRTISGTLETLPELASWANISPPALLVIGEVVASGEKLSWFTPGPLSGQRILITRPREDAETSASMLEDLGADVLMAPMVSIEPVDDPTELDQAIAQLPKWDWLVFTSSNGVDHFMRRLRALRRDARALGHVKIAVIGTKTAAALDRHGLLADLVPSSSCSEGLAEELGPAIGGKAVLLPRADRGREVLVEELAKVADICQVTTYRSVDAVSLPDDILRSLTEGSIHWITLTSSAIAQRLHAIVPETAREKIGVSIRVAAISPLTASAANRLGWHVAAVAKTATWESLVQSIIDETKRSDR